MARQDQMEALYEFFGGTPNTFSTSPSSTFSFVKTVAKGEPIQKLQLQTPLLFMTAPDSTETFLASGLKVIHYNLNAVLVWQSPGTQANGADRGSSALYEFYSYIDQITARIRTNPTLITTSYPTGASLYFGKTIKVSEQHSVENNLPIFVASFSISSEEQSTF